MPRGIHWVQWMHLGESGFAIEVEVQKTVQEIVKCRPSLEPTYFDVPLDRSRTKSKIGMREYSKRMRVERAKRRTLLLKLLEMKRVVAAIFVAMLFRQFDDANSRKFCCSTGDACTVV